MKSEKDFSTCSSSCNPISNTSSHLAEVKIAEYDENDGSKIVKLHVAKVRIAFHPLTETFSTEIVKTEVVEK